MKNLKKIIFVLTLIIFIIIIILLVLNSKNNGTAEDDFSNSEFEKTDVYETSNKIEKVKNKNKYYAVQRILNTYIRYIKESNGIIDFQEYDDDEIKSSGMSKLYNILDKEYITEQNLKQEDIQKFIKKYEKYDIEIENMYMYEKTTEINIYFVIFNIDGNENKLLVKTDSENMTFSIFLDDYIKEKGYSNDMNVDKINISSDNIDNNNDNQFKYINISDEYMAKQYINSIKNNMLMKTEYTYENLMDKEYKEKRFGNVENFVEYVQKEQEEIDKIELSKYMVNNYDDYVEYICLDQNGNYYIINEKSVMNYTFKLDTYTLPQEKFVNTYDNSSDKQKVQMNIDKFIQMINRHDYRTSYNCIADGFKNNYFNDQSNFEKYIKNNFYSYNKLQFVSCEQKTTDIYVCRIQISDLTEENSEIKTIDIIIQLGNNTEFKISFSM